ncbi:protein FAM162B [Pholidichthys leucotaenia]
MNFITSCLSTGNLLGQRCRQVTAVWGHRGMCDKMQESKLKPAQDSRPSFKVPGYRPSEMDKKFLLWVGRYKSADQIPETLSFETIDAARNKIRVRVAYVMMALTLVACGVMVFTGKQAVRRNESLIAQNLEKKARWREEAKKDA